MTPKSLLSRPGGRLAGVRFPRGTCFQEILPDTKIFANPGDVQPHHLLHRQGLLRPLAHRQEDGIENAAILRIEQLYPFHREMVRAILSQYPNARHFVWCQEEPLNMGAWSYIFPRLERAVGAKSATPAAATAASPPPAPRPCTPASRRRSLPRPSKSDP